MKTITSLKLRNQLGEILDQVRYEREPIMVTRHKKMVAILLPYEEKKMTKPPEVQLDQISSRLRKLVGTGKFITPEEEKKEIKEYLEKKYQ